MSQRNSNKKIVVLGGGNAMPKAVLEGLKKYPVKLSVISAMLDSGGSAGTLRKAFHTQISFGDIRRAVLALSEADAKTKNHFSFRDSEGHIIANAFCTALTVATGSPEMAINKLSERLKVPLSHQVLPATLDEAELWANLENGQTIKGEANIDMPKHNGALRIKEVFLKPEVQAHPQSLKAIREANLIVIGPGDLYSSLAQILLTRGLGETIRKSRAKKVYICNLMQKHGETNNFSVLEFTKEIEKYLGGKVDYVVYNTANPSKELLRKYKKEHPELLEMVKIDEGLPKNKFIGQDLLKKESIEHNSKIVSQTLISLI